MMTFCINPISANGQCFDSEQICRVLLNLVDCFEYLLPALDKGRAKLIYDSGLERRRLNSGEPFWTSIDSLPKQFEGKNIKQLWLLYTRNRAEVAAGETVINVIISSSEADLGQIEGEINEYLLQENSGWLSFGGHRLHESPQLRVHRDPDVISRIDNAYNRDSFKRLLPRYEPSAKHRRDTYFDSAGRKISCMPLESDEAQRLLLTSVTIDNARWAFHAGRGRYYCFKITQANVYHGYEVERDEIPTQVWSKL